MHQNCNLHIMIASWWYDIHRIWYPMNKELQNLKRWRSWFDNLNFLCPKQSSQPCDQLQTTGPSWFGLKLQVPYCYHWQLFKLLLVTVATLCCYWLLFLTVTSSHLPAISDFFLVVFRKLITTSCWQLVVLIFRCQKLTKSDKMDKREHSQLSSINILKKICSSCQVEFMPVTPQCLADTETRAFVWT